MAAWAASAVAAWAAPAAAGGVAGLGQGGGLFNDVGRHRDLPRGDPRQAARRQHVHRQPGASAARGGAGRCRRQRHRRRRRRRRGTSQPGGTGGSATGGTGGAGGDANDGDGGGLFNAGTVSFTGVTVNLSNNKAQSGFGGSAAPAAAPSAGRRLRRLRPFGQRRQRHRRHRRRQRRGRDRLGRRHLQRDNRNPHPQARAWGEEGLQAGEGHRHHHDQRRLDARRAGAGGQRRRAATAGSGGTATPGQSGATDLFSVGIGGGIATFGTAHVDNTTITGNHASTNDDNVDGMITP